MADRLIRKLTFFQIFQSGLATLTAKLIKDYGEFGASYALEGDNTTVALLPEQANFKDRVMQDKKHE